MRRELLALLADLNPGAPTVALLEHLVAESDRRAEVARRNARSYSVRVERGIRAAICAVPAGDRPIESWQLASKVIGRIKRLEPKTFQLKRVPDVELVRAVLRKMADERCELTREATLQSAPVGDEVLPAVPEMREP